MECSAFLVDAAVAGERWAPYLRWASQLRPQDVVATFNYDLVVERLGVKTSRSGIPDLEDDTSDLVGARLLKLHGSVDWSLGAGSEIQLCHTDLFTPRDNVVNRLIGSPGQTKAALCDGPLKSQWDAATAALRSADAVIFVGYRFPPTDAHSREAILGAIRGNQAPHLSIRVILGPSPNPDIKRLEGLLRWAISERAAGTAEVIVEPLYAEDFLSVYDRRLLV